MRAATFRVQTFAAYRGKLISIGGYDYGGLCTLDSAPADEEAGIAGYAKWPDGRRACARAKISNTNDFTLHSCVPADAPACRNRVSPQRRYAL